MEKRDDRAFPVIPSVVEGPPQPSPLAAAANAAKWKSPANAGLFCFKHQPSPNRGIKARLPPDVIPSGVEGQPRAWTISCSEILQQRLRHRRSVPPRGASQNPRSARAPPTRWLDPHETAWIPSEIHSPPPSRVALRSRVKNLETLRRRRGRRSSDRQG